MQDSLPWLILGFVILLIGVAPWRRFDPKHEFTAYMLNNVAGRDLTDRSVSAHKGLKNIERRTTAGWHHRAGSAHV
jgi:hypothetical protein